MKFTKLMMVTPVFFFVILALVILLLPSLILPFWLTKFKGIEKKTELISHNTSHQILSEIGKRAELLSTMNTSALNLAKVLNSSLYGVDVSFGAIQDRVSPILFQAISTIPLVSQISYTGVDNLFFSYQYKDDNLIAVYTNSSQFANMSFTQQVNPNNGKLYGEPSSTTATGNIQDYFSNQTADVAGKGSVSLAFPVNKVARFFSGIEFYGGGYFCLASREGKVILEEVPNTCSVLEGYFGNITCDGSSARGPTVKIQESSYQVFCSDFEILRVQSVYILALPLTEKFNHRNAIVALILVILTSISMIISVLAFIFVILRASRREMYLCSALIKQMEVTQQAERKYLNKSLAFASASHDVRASLAGITGLTEMSQERVESESELGTNLKQIKDCTNYLLGILNTILDMSKIEAGKMQLEEIEFDVAQLVEDVVDLYNPVGSKNGIDVILDPQDGSIFSRYSKVRGDRTKLRQILSNLVNNAVKFTSEGHVVVRGWVKKPNLNNPLYSSVRQSRFFGLSSCFFSRKSEEIYDEQSKPRLMIQENSDFFEFVFEVEDTGSGIPKEERNSIFENYVQVKKKDEPEKQESTGLGLGIVQSLVRLMGGEIKIIDKKYGEKGTCFRFNIFLARSEINHTKETVTENDLESQVEYSSHESFISSGPRPRTFSSKQEHSRVVLFIQGEKRRKITRKFMDRVGVEVSVVNEWHQLSHTLNKVKKEMKSSKSSNSSVSDLSLSSECKSVPLSSMDGEDEMPQNFCRNSKVKNVSNFVLIIIDTSSGPFIEFIKAVAEFRNGLRNTCYRIVWIDKPGAQNMMHSKGLDEDKLPLTDLIITKPFHGSRLFRVIGLLPEFGGSERRKSKKHQGRDLPSSSGYPQNDEDRSESKSKEKEISSPKIPTKDEILSGKKILVVDDNALQRRIARTAISKLGAIVELCENGEEAVQLVSRGLSDRSKHRATTTSLPYDYIFMDCEMPVMDGFEATRTIREEEGFYGVHIPIIALTAHTTGEEANRMMQNGIDFFVTKPLNKDKLIHALLRIDSSN